MKRKLNAAFKSGLSVILFAALTLSVSAQKQKKTEKATEKAPQGIVLKYNFPVGKPLTYSSRTNIDQEMEMNGSQIPVTVSINLVCTITGQGNVGDNLKLDIRLDTLSQNIESPNGSGGGPVTDVEGKSFTMILSPLGKELDLKDAEKITYTVEGQESNVSQTFTDYFPDLQNRELKPGDTWSSNDTLNSKATTMSVKQIAKSDNKFEGIVNVDGLECARITSTVSGTREQTGESMGMDISIKGTFTGTNEFLFAVKEGYLVKETANSKMIGNIELSGGQNMSMPLTATTVSTRILKK